MFSKYSKIGLAGMAVFANLIPGFAQKEQHPNVVLILTDDQGYGDLGSSGNLYVKTPVLDKLAEESVRFSNFYVSPVCAPTRSSLMTGRFSLRTGIRDTYNGGAIMAANEITIAEMLRQADYRSGIFGKWHLGDNYPFRPGDQGFDESLIHLSGGMGQAGDITTFFKGDSSYFNPVLWHNGKQEAYQGYCSDIFADNAIKFIDANKDKPFFCYLAFNAPHTPLQVPDKYYKKYKDIDPSSGFGPSGKLEMSEREKEAARRVYAMVDNIDENVGKLLKKLDDLGIAKNTVVIFMSDNGPAEGRYIAGMRGMKGSVYRGGVRVPFFIRYPMAFAGGRKVETTAAHIDVLPTLAHLCHVKIPDDRTIDGKNLLPVIKGEQVDWANRPLFFYWNRRYPELYSNMAIQEGNMKLVGHADYDAKATDFELFNISKDPGEQHNLVAEDTKLATTMKSDLDHMLNDLVNSKNLLTPLRIVIGSDKENPVILNRNDAEGQHDIGTQQEVYGLWKVSIVKQGKYNIRFKFIKPVLEKGKMYLETKPIVYQMQWNQLGKDQIEMKNVRFEQMDYDFVPYYSMRGKKIFPLWVEVEKVD